MAIGTRCYFPAMPPHLCDTQPREPVRLASHSNSLVNARHPLAASHSPRPHRVAGAAPKPHSAVLELHVLFDRHFAPHELAREERAYADRGNDDQALNLGMLPTVSSDDVF